RSGKGERGGDDRRSFIAARCAASRHGCAQYGHSPSGKKPSDVERHHASFASIGTGRRIDPLGEAVERCLARGLAVVGRVGKSGAVYSMSNQLVEKLGSRNRPVKT